MSNDHKHKQVLSIVFTAALVGCGGGDGDGGNAGNVRVDGGRTAAATAEQCQALASKVLPNVEITLATAVTGGSFLPPDASAEVNEAPAFCRFAGTATPTADSEIKFEVWMPLQGWNGKFVQAGNGGYGRGFNQPVTGMLPALKRGYAVAGTDMGHPVTVGYDASWAEGHPEKVVDWAYRAVHETAKTSKEVISSLYNGAPSRSYFVGCSDGGREALMEAQRFPDDFDGIIAGAPANDWVGLSLGHIWQRNALARSGFTLAKMNALNAAALGAVDGLDGVTDGVINDPTKVAFDPAAMACPAGVDDASCLTPSQVEAAREIYAGPGVNIFPGMYLGTESGWNFAMNDGGLGPGLYQYMVYQDTTWDMSTLSTPQDYAKAKADAASAAATISSIDPNLDTFRGRGGKLIMYHGLSDQAIAAKSSEIYYRSVVSRVGGLEETMQFTRLFMAPGMRHCGGGNGADTFDALTALEDWVEKGTAPTQLIASKGGPGGLGLTMSSGTGEVTRPLCPYPQVAQYKGSGSTDSAGNFVCTAP